jgi:DHA3 family macrolide efflux protein-like MFS transporter
MNMKKNDTAHSQNRALPANWKSVIVVIWSGQAFSIFSTIAASFAAMWYITENTGSPLLLAFGSIAALLPVGVLSPLGGVVADRFDRRWVMVTADATVGAISLLLGLVVLLGRVELPLLLLALAARSAAQAFHAPAMTALMPLMVPERALVRINALDQMLVSISSMGGPVLGIFLYTSIGFEAVLFLDALGAAIACVCLVLASVPSTGQKAGERQRIGASMLSGLRFVRADGALSRLLLLCTCAMLLFMPLGSLYPLMTYEWFGGNGYHASLVEAVYGIGLIVGSALLLIWGGGQRLMPIVLVSGVIIGLVIVGIGLLQPNQFVLFVVLTGIMSAGVGSFNAPVLPMIQRRVPQEMLGRVTSLFITISTLASPIGLLIAGVGAERTGLSPWFLVTGLLLCLLQLVAILSRRLRSVEASDETAVIGHAKSEDGQL